MGLFKTYSEKEVKRLKPTVEKLLLVILYFSFNELENSFFILVNTTEDILSVQSAIMRIPPLHT